nr:heavy metal-binding domain-containing protein [Vibrio neptunius]
MFCSRGKIVILTTTESVPNREIEDILGVVNGNVVQTKHVGRDMMAGLKSVFGGELKGYTEMLSEARDTAIERLTSEATDLGADAVVGIRFSTSSIMEGSSELMVFGTAVKLRT